MNYTITYKTFFLLALSIWPFHCDGDESMKKNEIKKLQKNISSELLASFGRQLTKPEDIKVKLHTAELN